VDGSQHIGVSLSMTICFCDIRLVTTFWLDRISVGTPLTMAVMTVMGSDLVDLVVRFLMTGYRLHYV